MDINSLMNGILIILCICAVLINLSGNGLIIVSSIVSQGCRNEVGLLIANAAILDLSAIVTFVFIFLDCFDNIFPDLIEQDALTHYCLIIVPYTWISQHARTFAITGIALNRYIRIVYNSLYVRIYQRYKLHIWCALLVWIAIALIRITVPLLFDIQIRGNFMTLDTTNNNTQSLCRAIILYHGNSSNDLRTINTFLSICSTYFISSTICGFCYINIFRYFYKSKRTLESFAVNRKTSTIVNGNSKNLKLHFSVLFRFFAAHMFGITFVVTSNIPFILSPFMYYFGLICIHSITIINPWLSIAYMKEFNHVYTSFKQFKSPQSQKKNMIVGNLIEMHVKTVM